MITLAKTTQSTSAPPEAIFKLWADVNHWSGFDHGIEWAKLEEAFTPGSSFILKPKGGPKVRATIVNNLGL